MSRAALFIIAPNWRQLKYPSTDERRNKPQSIPVMRSSGNKKEWAIDTHNNMGVFQWNEDEASHKKRADYGIPCTENTAKCKQVSYRKRRQGFGSRREPGMGGRGEVGLQGGSGV